MKEFFKQRVLMIHLNGRLYYIAKLSQAIKWLIINDNNNDIDNNNNSNNNDNTYNDHNNNNNNDNNSFNLYQNKNIPMRPSEIRHGIYDSFDNNL